MNRCISSVARYLSCKFKLSIAAAGRRSLVSTRAVTGRQPDRQGSAIPGQIKMGARPRLPRWTEIGLSPTLDLPLINLKPCEQADGARGWPWWIGGQVERGKERGREKERHTDKKDSGRERERQREKSLDHRRPKRGMKIIIAPVANELGAAGSCLDGWDRMDLRI